MIRDSSIRKMMAKIVMNAIDGSCGKQPGNWTPLDRITDIACSRAWIIESNTKPPGEVTDEMNINGYGFDFCVRSLGYSPSAKKMDIGKMWYECNYEILKLISEEYNKVRVTWGGRPKKDKVRINKLKLNSKQRKTVRENIAYALKIMEESRAYYP